MSKSLEDLTDEILGRIIEDLPKPETSNTMEEALEKALENTTPKGRSGASKTVKREDKGGWHIP